MLMHNPPHPGEVIKELCLDPLGLTVTAAAEALGVSRKTLSAMSNSSIAISFISAVELLTLIKTHMLLNDLILSLSSFAIS